MRRIATDLAIERQVGKLLPNTRIEVSEARMLLMASAKLRADLGVPTAQFAGPAAEDHATFGNDAVDRVARDPVKRARVLAIARRSLRLGDVEPDPHDVPDDEIE